MSNPRRRRVLVVDDDPHIRTLLRTLLDLEELDIVEAANGAHALEVVEEHQPDVVLLDVMMPGVDGFQVCRQLRANPALDGLGIILLTARANHEDRDRGHAAGADAYLTKPFSPLELLETMERIPERLR